MMQAEFWVAIAFVVFVGVLIYFGVHRLILGVIDQRRASIQAELDEARRLKQEAQALLIEYRNKRSEAEREAQDIIANAQAEAARLSAEAKVKMEEFLARRTRMAETKIAQAETQALADVRAAAAEAAVAAAAKVLSETVKGAVAERLVANGIADLKTKLN
jgi:F-type H+-transporting ATPase subunit b